VADHPQWPVLRHYDGAHLDRISLPLGGIGAGTVGFGGRGDLRDFEVGNRPAKGFRPGTAFFAIRARRGDEPPQAKLLEGPLGDHDFEGAYGSTAGEHGFPRYARASFDAAYPFGQVLLEDDHLPRVAVRGFNPLVPGDLEASSLPVAILRFDVANDESTPLDVTVAASLENFVGANGTLDDTGGNANEVVRADGLVGLRMTAPGLAPGHEAAGEVVLAASTDAAASVTTRTGWGAAGWSEAGARLRFWDDLLEDGALDECGPGEARPIGSIAVGAVIPPQQTHTFEFLLTWVFPQRRAWAVAPSPFGQEDAIVGNHYAVRWPDPWQTAIAVARDLPALEERTVRAISAIVDSSAPPSIREAALFNISTLRSQTVFRTADGRFFGWEGVNDREGCCSGTCTHVWGYEFATSHWFSELAWSLRETQYELATDERGLMSFRVGQPLEQARNWGVAAADGQMACLVHLLHDWRLTGDDDRLRRLWPAARRSLEFAWVPGGWDADQDGVMEGAQHNTMDVEYHGPNPQMGTWYLAALQACAELADHLGEADFAAKCRELHDAGSAWLDAHLFTGSYYRHQIRPAAERVSADGLVWQEFEAGLPEDHLQLGDGVLVDQLVGQYAARVAGLGPVLDARNIRTTLDTVFARNFRPSLREHFTNMRTFALGDEAGVLMSSYEEGKRPAQPFPFFSEIMTGFEYTLATGHIQDGDRGKALQIIEAIRARYDGRRRSPFDEAECGHHYARAMASWSAFLAWNRFQYNAQTRTFALELEAPAGSTFWSTGSAWGVWRQDGPAAELEVVEGTIDIERVATAVGVVAPGGGPTRRGGDVLRLTLA
jgi:uncharacterized protein (DUF608 family)